MGRWGLGSDFKMRSWYGRPAQPPKTLAPAHHLI